MVYEFAPSHVENPSSSATAPLKKSEVHAHIPVCFDTDANHMALLGASVLSTTNNIPFLASNELTGKKLKMVLDLPQPKVVTQALSIEFPICLIGGRLAIGVSEFPECRSSLWKQFTDMFIADVADRDFVFCACSPADGPVACQASRCDTSFISATC